MGDKSKTKKRQQIIEQSTLHLLEVAFDTVEDAACLLDSKCKILKCNDAMEKLLEKPAAEIVGHTCWKLIHGTSKPIDGCPVERMRGTLRRETLVLQIGDRWFDVIAVPIMDKVRDLSGAIHILADITERKITGNVLQKSEDRFKQFFENAPDYCYMITPEGTILDVNKAALMVLGYNKEELVGQPLQTIYAPESLPKIRQLFTVRKKTGKINDKEMVILTKEGNRRTVLLSVVSTRDRAGKILYSVSLQKDITERKQAEKSLSRANRALITLSACNEALVHSHEEFNLLRDICQLIVEIGGYRFAWIGYAEFDKKKTVRPVAHFGQDEGYLQKVKITWSDTKWGQGPTGTAIRKGTPNIVRIIPKESHYAPWRREARKRGYNSSIALPLIHDEQTLGALNIYSTEADALDPDEVKLLMELANDLAYGIVALRTRAEHKQAEQAIKFKDELIHMTSEMAKVGGFEFEVETLQGTWTSEVAKIHDVDPTQETSVLFGLSFYSGKYREEIERAIKEAIELAKPYDLELELVSAKGIAKWVRTKGLPIKEGGKVVKVRGIFQDITELKQAEQALRNSEEKFHKAFNTSPDSITITSVADGKIVEANETSYRLTGYTRDELVGHSTTELNFWVDSKDRERYISMLLEKGHVFDMEAEFRIKGGEIRTGLVCGETIELSGKQYILGTIRDITERKQIEQALRRSEQKYRTLVENIPQKIFHKDENSVYISCNANYAYDLKMDPDEINGKTDYDFHPKELAEKYQEDDRRVIESGKAESLEERYFHDGQERTIQTHKVPVRCENGDITGVLGIFEDITDQKMAQEKLFDSMKSTIAAIARTTELRDPYTAGHQQRVSKLACAIARKMGFSEEKVEGIRMAGVVHDIGKTYVPAEILAKPGRLTDVEYSLIKVHSQAGYDILKDIKFPWPIAQIVLQHHERLNGSGYPQGLTGKDIILEARVLAVADVVEAMASHRPYRPAVGIDSALDEIRQNKDILYDADVVDTCVKLFIEKDFEFE